MNKWINEWMNGWMEMSSELFGETMITLHFSQRNAMADCLLVALVFPFPWKQSLLIIDYSYQQNEGQRHVIISI